MVILLELKELPRGRRRDEYLGVFESADAARTYLSRWNAPLLWRELGVGSGPFESVCLNGVKPKSVERASSEEFSVDFAILEFS